MYIYFTTKAWKMNFNVKITEDFSSISQRKCWRCSQFSRLADMLICFSFLSSLLALVLAGCHHHLAKLVKVHGPAPVLVNLRDNPVQVLLGQVGVDLRHDGSELGHGDEALPTYKVVIVR